MTFNRRFRVRLFCLIPILLCLSVVNLLNGTVRAAESFFSAAARTHAGWGLSALAEYYEVMGQFDAAETLYHAFRHSYALSHPYYLWGFVFRTNQPNIEEEAEALLQWYVRSQDPDTEIRAANPMQRYRILYLCYLMDIPYPEQLGTFPLFEEFRRSNNAFPAFLAWLDGIEKEKTSQEVPGETASILPMLRNLYFMPPNNTLDADSQQSPFSVLFRPRRIDSAFQMLAALFVADQRSEKPGTLDSDEIDFILRSTQDNAITKGLTQAILYTLGRYHAIYGQDAVAQDYFQRVLASRAFFNHFKRTFAVKELRKYGLTNEEYIRYSQGDPRMPVFNISKEIADVLCRQHFRIYTESPSATLLARPLADSPIAQISQEDYGQATDWTPGLYRVTGVQFRGVALPTAATGHIHWMVPRHEEENTGDWSTFGIAMVGPVPTQTLNRHPTGYYPVRFGSENPVSALASFHGDRLVLIIALDGQQPESITIIPESNNIRIEMTKTAEIP